MRDLDPFDDDVRALLRDAHRHEPEPPPFERLWQRAYRHRAYRHRAIRGSRYAPLRSALIPTVAAALTLTVALAWFATVRATRARATRQAANVHTLLASVQAVDVTPLDFLLETPSAELVRRTPRFGETVPLIDPSLFQLQKE